MNKIIFSLALMFVLALAVSTVQAKSCGILGPSSYYCNTVQGSGNCTDFMNNQLCDRQYCCGLSSTVSPDYLVIKETYIKDINGNRKTSFNKGEKVQVLSDVRFNSLSQQTICIEIYLYKNGNYELSASSGCNNIDSSTTGIYDWGYIFNSLGVGNYTANARVTYTSKFGARTVQDYEWPKFTITNTGGGRFCYLGDVYVSESDGSSTLVEDCGDDYYSNWSANYCSNNAVIKNRTFYDKGCSAAICFSSPSSENQTVQTCSQAQLCDMSQGGCYTPQPKPCAGESQRACGNCGAQTRTCNNGIWSDWSICSSQGICTPGSAQSCSANGISGTQICNSQCSWSTCNFSKADCSVTGCLSGFTCCNSQCMPASSSSCAINIAEKPQAEVSMEKIQDLMYDEGYYYKIKIKFILTGIEEYKGWWKGGKFYYEISNNVYELNYKQDVVSFVKTSEKREKELDGPVFQAYDPNKKVSFDCLRDYYIKLESNPICAPLYLSACQNTNFSDPDISKRLGFIPVFAMCSVSDYGISYGDARKMAQDKYDEIGEIGRGASSLSQNALPDCDNKFIIENLATESAKNEIKFDFDIVNIGNCSAKTFWGVFGGDNGTNSLGIADLNANEAKRISAKISYKNKGLHFPLIALDKIDEEGDRGVDIYSIASTDTSECPFACCSSSPGYLDKSCQRGYKCLKNKCLPYA
jgi:hypothetical protein